jgi:hypothetical protein
LNRKKPNQVHREFTIFIDAIVENSKVSLAVVIYDWQGKLIKACTCLPEIAKSKAVSWEARWVKQEGL